MRSSCRRGRVVVAAANGPRRWRWLAAPPLRPPGKNVLDLMMMKARRTEGLLLECTHPGHVGERMKPRGWFRRAGGGRRYGHCRECRRESDSEQRARRRGAGVVKVPRGWIRVLWQAQRGRCSLCLGVIHGRYHIDHRIPIARGGQHVLSNLAITHVRCNLVKGARYG